MTAQTWRVVLDDGATKDVSVVSFGLLRWVVAGAQSANVRNSPRDAIAAVWSNIVEIRGPGELTTAEAVAAETARCIAICKARAKYYRDEAAEWERRGYTPEIHSRESAALNTAELLDVRATDD